MESVMQLGNLDPRTEKYDVLSYNQKKNLYKIMTYKTKKV